jgi:hypothetical protein
MFNVVDIIKKDAATYYDYNSGNPTRRYKTMLAFAALAILAGFAIQVAPSDFLSGALSAQSILVGFSFNVLFYLVANRLTTPSTFSSIEHELRFERLSKLSDEVFDNVTYFNVVAIASALLSLALLLFGSEDCAENLRRLANAGAELIGIPLVALRWAEWLIASLSLTALVFLLLESVYTFLRAVGRVRFYFGMLKMMDDDAQAVGTRP